jgi:hypothetical protein
MTDLRTADSLNAEGNLNVLLEEYRTLRAEVNERINGRMTLVGFVLAAGALLADKTSLHGWRFIAVAAGVLLMIGTVWAWTWHILTALSKQLAMLETKINECAAEAFGPAHHGDLLSWEKNRRQKKLARRQAPNNRSR